MVGTSFSEYVHSRVTQIYHNFKVSDHEKSVKIFISKFFKTDNSSDTILGEDRYPVTLHVVLKVSV